MRMKPRPKAKKSRLTAAILTPRDRYRAFTRVVSRSLEVVSCSQCRDNAWSNAKGPSSFHSGQRARRDPCHVILRLVQSAEFCEIGMLRIFVVVQPVQGQLQVFKRSFQELTRLLLRVASRRSPRASERTDSLGSAIRNSGRRRQLGGPKSEYDRARETVGRGRSFLRP